MRNFIAAGLLAISTLANAQWAQEPASIMGIELGGRRDAIPRCPPGDTARQARTPCLEADSADRSIGTLWGLPLNFLLGGGRVRFIDGRVQLIAIGVDRDDSYRRLKAILVERYGEPHEVEVKSVVTNGGAVLDSEESMWRGPKVLILLSERAGYTDQSRVAFSYRPLGQKKIEDDAKRDRSDASKL